MQTSSVRSEGRPYTYRTSNEVFLYRTLNDPILEQVCQRVEMVKRRHFKVARMGVIGASLEENILTGWKPAMRTHGWPLCGRC